MSRNILHDVLKIKYSDEGYLPYYPYHLISEEEMIDAFIFNESNFFSDWYPCMYESVRAEYDELKSFIQTVCESYKNDPETSTIPDWVYSYMLGEVVGPQSEQKDVHDLLVLLNLDNLYDEFTPHIMSSIVTVSKKALGTSRTRSNTENTYRPVTMFGEPHIIKYLRLEKVSVRP